MTPESTPNLRAELEARITAMLLGELSADDAELLCKVIEHDAELKKIHDQLKRTIERVRESAVEMPEKTSAPLKLSEERRQKLLAQFKTVRPREFVAPPRRRSRILALAAAAAMITLMAILLLPSLSKSKAKAQRVAILSKMSPNNAPDVAGSDRSRYGIETLAEAPPEAQLGEGNRGTVVVLPRAGEVPATPVASATPAALAPARESVGFRIAGVPEVSGEGDVRRSEIVLPAQSGAEGQSKDWFGYFVKQDAESEVAVTNGLVLGDAVRNEAREPQSQTSTARLGGGRGGFGASGGGGGGFGGGGFAAAGGGVQPEAGIGDDNENVSTLSGRSANVSGNNLVRFNETMVAQNGSVPAEDSAVAPQSGRGLLENRSSGAQDESQLFYREQLEAVAHGPANRGETEQNLAAIAPSLGRDFRYDIAQRSNEQMEGAPGSSTGTATFSLDKAGKPIVVQEDENTKRQIARSFSSLNEPAATAGVLLSYDGAAPDRDMYQFGQKPDEIEQLQRRARSNSEVTVAPAERPATPAATHPVALGVVESETVKQLAGQGQAVAGEPDFKKPATTPPVPQPEIQTRDNAFSTFSLNVSDVSFKLAAASLENSVMPDAAFIRTEEFINAFDYRDPEPAPGAPIAFAWERARYPFAHNRDLLRFSLKTAATGREAGKPLNLVLLLDSSGSMERADRVEIIRAALRVLARQLQPQDKLSVVTFARAPRLWADGVPGAQAGETVERLIELTPEGGTNLEEAMSLAYTTALKHYAANGVNRVVLLTDGAANLGDVQPESLKDTVEAHRRQGVALDCFGIGWEGYNDDLLETLSRNGDGRYGFLNSPEEAASGFAAQLAGALQVAASDVKVQVEFNPRRVISYRLLGYAKHQLTKEQFRDNTVDAAEIAAAESGNALYTVELNPAGEGPIATVRVRFKVPGTSDYREHAWPVPYNGNAVALDQSSHSLRLAATAGAFAEWLASSPFAAEVTPDSLLGILRGVPELCGADQRPMRLEWMIRQAKSTSGR